MKHTIPSGFATQYKTEEIVEIYQKARDADARRRDVDASQSSIGYGLAQGLIAGDNHDC